MFHRLIRQFTAISHSLGIFCGSLATQILQVELVSVSYAPVYRAAANSVNRYKTTSVNGHSIGIV